MLGITWRLQRTGLIGMSAFGMLYAFIQTSAYASAAGSSAASHAAFGHQVELLGASISYLLPLPVHPETIGGYLQWRIFGALPLLFGFWCLLSASGATRGDEDRGLVEQWLNAGMSRPRYLAYRFLAFVVAAVVAIGATSAAIDLGAARAGSALPPVALLEQSLALLALCIACYGIAVVAAQLATPRNAAAGLAGAMLLVLFLVNGFSRTVDGLRPLAAAASPFYYYDRGTPLTPGGAFDPAATAVLLVAGGLLAGLAACLMGRRDIGSSVLRRRPRSGPRLERPSPNPLLRMPIGAGLYEQRIGLLAWAAGTLVAAAFIASIGRQMVNLVNTPGAFAAYLTAAGHGDPYVAITGFFWFGICQLLLSVYAITQVARWTADDNEGRLEMVLSAPVSRARVVGERALTLLLGTAAVVAASSLGFYLAAHAAGIDLHAGDLTAASLALIPFVLSFAAIGALLASRVPRATVGVLATFAFLSYLLSEGGPLMKWPDWTLKLSLFSLYGTPLASGVYWTGLWILLAVTLAGFGLAAVLMQRREVGR